MKKPSPALIGASPATQAGSPEAVHENLGHRANTGSHGTISNVFCEDLGDISNAYKNRSLSSVEVVNGETLEVETIYKDEVILGDSPYDNRERAYKRIKLPSGRIYTSMLTKAHPDVIADFKPKIGIMLPGFTEIPTASDSSGYNFHEERARRNPNEDTISFDHYGLSPDDFFMWPTKAIQAGLLSDEEQAEDFLLMSAYYAKDSKATLIGTSAGVEDIVHMADLNETILGDNKLEIEKLVGFAPKLVAKNIPPEANFRGKEKALETKARIIGSFVMHTAINFGSIGIKDPRTLWENRGILTALRQPAAFVLPAQFINHTDGTEYDLLRRVSRNYPVILIEPEKDVLRNEGQIEELNRDNPNPIEVIVVNGEGHISLPLNPVLAFDALEGKSPDSALNLVGSGVQKALAGVNSIHRILKSPISKLAA